MDSIALDVENRDRVNAEWVGPVLRARREYASHGPAFVATGMHLEDRSVGLVQPGEHDDVVALAETVERLSEFGLDDEPAVGCTFVALTRGGAGFGHWRLDEPDWAQQVLGQVIVTPPSTTMVWPVTKPPASDASHTSVAASSAGSPMRPNNTRGLRLSM